MVTSSSEKSGIGKYTKYIYNIFPNIFRILYINTTYEKFSDEVDVITINLPKFFSFLKYAKRRVCGIFHRIFKKRIIKIINKKDVWITDPSLYWLCNHTKISIITVHDILPIIPGNINYFSFRLFETYREVNFLYKLLFNSFERFVKILENVEKTDFVVVPSKYTEEQLKMVLKMLDIKIPKTFVLPPPIPSKYKPERVRRERFRNKKIILHVGSDEPRKNVITILEALKLLPKDYIFVKIGSFGKRSMKFIRENNLKNRIIFLGKVSEEDLIKWYNMSDVFVFPSFYEGFGLPPLEAMACGCPVISSNRTSLKEVCGDAAVYLEDPTDPKELSEKVVEILENEEYRREIINRGFENIDRFREENIRRKYSNVLTRVVIKTT